uniref:uncharacterized protein LOC105350992 n=1 Tax=Fragaria vesca subsp. vesca TaxID=101020 RepID=UPI0005C981CD|nr:PREDICTED: uncharacterized protein LOC105350992 [Fragaria vesca subsp. vesca]
MSDFHRQYYTQVKWKRCSPFMNIETISSDDVLPIQFNLFMPHQDPKLSKNELSRVLTLRRDELPSMLCNCVGATGGLKRTGYRVKHLFKASMSCQAYSQMKKYLSGCRKLKFAQNMIMKVLESLVPLPQEKHRDTVAKIFTVLATIAEDAFLIQVNIYVVNRNPNPNPASMSAMVNELEKVRLNRSCGICMEEFDKGVMAIRLPCFHIFHGNCIFRWLQKDHKCPLCRHPMPHDDADHADDTSSSVTKYQYSYYTRIESKICTPAPSSTLEIQFNFYKSNQSGSLLKNGEVLRHKTEPDAEQIHLKTEPRLLTIPSHCELQPTMITQVLRSLDVPQNEQPPIVAKIFETVAADGNCAFINADIYHEALKLFDRWAFSRKLFRIRRIGIDLPITDEHDARIARELDEESFSKPRPKPATKSAIEGLERVRVDASCGICMDDFEDGLLATRFPCLHIFHGDCILRWLETHYKCPLCRYPLLCD